MTEKRDQAVDVEMTAEVIDDMVRYLEGTIKTLKRLAEKMRERQRIDYASDAMQEVSNMFLNLRMDLLVTRPIRAFQSLLRD